MLSAGLSPLPLGIAHGLIAVPGEVPRTAAPSNRSARASCRRSKDAAGVWIRRRHRRQKASPPSSLRCAPVQATKGLWSVEQRTRLLISPASIPYHFLVEAKGAASPSRRRSGKGPQVPGPARRPRTDSLPDERLRAALYVPYPRRRGHEPVRKLGAKTLDNAHYKGLAERPCRHLPCATSDAQAGTPGRHASSPRCQIGQVRTPTATGQNHYDPLIPTPSSLHLLVRLPGSG